MHTPRPHALWLLALAAALSTGCATPTAQEQAQSARSLYVKRIAFLFVSAIRPQSTTNPHECEAVMLLQYGPQGQYTGGRITESSGDGACDRALQNALRQTAPNLPPAPTEAGQAAPFAIPIKVRFWV